MSGHPNRCGTCGRPLAAIPDAVHRRCVACAAKEEYREPIYRGMKPPDHGQRVARGMRMYFAHKRSLVIVETDL